jgi:hypothetical protein
MDERFKSFKKFKSFKPSPASSPASWGRTEVGVEPFGSPQDKLRAAVERLERFEPIYSNSPWRQRPLVGHFFVQCDGLRIARQLADGDFHVFSGQGRRFDG